MGHNDGMTAPLEPSGSPVFPDPTADPTDAPRTAAGAGTDRSDRGGPPPSERDIRPPVAWYWIGAVILVGSVLGAFVLLVTGTIAVINAPQAYPWSTGICFHSGLAPPGDRGH